MKKYRAVLAYDGTDFFGWQQQPGAPTVSTCLQDTFYTVFKQKITVIGASRTDTGVHALGQVATFSTDLDVPVTTLQTAWNNLLPKSILIRTMHQVTNDFHPCKNVRQKIYYYHLFFKRPLPVIARFGWYYDFMPHVDLEQFAQALACYEGEHDFGSFCKIEHTDTSTVRTIDNITITKLPHLDALRITIKGKSFLRFQIRRMIGYALDVARRKDLPVSYIHELLKTPNPQQTLLKAESCGLCLRKVVYKNECFNY
jgi:tRNA pseudouridine38-40 synthase